MILLVPVVIITLMYFMFQNVPHAARRAAAVQHRLPDSARAFPACS